MDPTSYYDMIHDMIAVRGFSYPFYVDNVKMLKYPSVFERLYCINKDGKVYSIINDSYLEWAYHNGLPYVTLSCRKNDKITLELFYIKDLMAYNYIANANDYLERGCKAVNIDGDYSNCRFDNIIYLDKNKIQ